MQGELFKYGPGPAHVAFKSGNFNRHLVAVGGLTDGLLFTRYIPLLQKQLQDQQISLVQPLLTSSHQGWGLGSVSRDADELFLLMQSLKRDHSSTGVIILGQSTGCQDAVMYATNYKNDISAPPLLGVVLQAPVSDRELFATMPKTAERIEAAKKAVESGRPDDVIFREMDFDGAAISAARWLSLAAPGGEDDMFSSDFSDNELTEKLQGLQGVPTLLMLSGSDEYVPPHVDYLALGNRMAKAIGPSARVAVVVGGNHGLSEHAQDGADLVAGFVNDL